MGKAVVVQLLSDAPLDLASMPKVRQEKCWRGGNGEGGGKALAFASIRQVTSQGSADIATAADQRRTCATRTCQSFFPARFTQR